VSTIAYVKAFAVYYLLSLVVGFGVGLVIGMVTALVLGGAGLDLTQIQIITGILGVLAGIPVHFFCFRFAIERFILKELNSRLG